MGLTGIFAVRQVNPVAPVPVGPNGRARAIWRRMRLALGMMAVGAFVSACVPEGPSVVVNPPAGGSLEGKLEEFATAVATAETIDDYCRAYGLRKAFGSTDQLSYDYVAKLRAQGHTQAEIARAADRLSTGGAGDRAISALKARGVKENDVGSLCGYGKAEVARGSLVGQLLRVTS